MIYYSHNIKRINRKLNGEKRKRKLLWYRLVVSTVPKAFFVKKRCSGRESNPGFGAQRHFEKPLCHLEISIFSVPSVQIKGKEALGTGLLSSPGAKGYFNSRPLGT